MNTEVTRSNYPKWVQYILMTVFGMFTVFASTYSGLRLFEKELVGKYEEIELRVALVERRQEAIEIKVEAGDRHTLDVIEMNRQVRMEQFNAINQRLDEIKDILNTMK